eukprot:TRINITY_DN2291_c0_g1_i1.p1 TRINITY_DN2291_c0_g1~~TRINITY_DN2291_c0_g1_i1.p1  ORF type:complete len:872 (+),score=238.88 TRINITY_DN2291_c0_g1_i1:90-2618(+)
MGGACCKSADGSRQRGAPKQAAAAAAAADAPPAFKQTVPPPPPVPPPRASPAPSPDSRQGRSDGGGQEAPKTINVSLWSTGSPRTQMFTVPHGAAPGELMEKLRAELGVGRPEHGDCFGLYQRGPWFGGPSGGEVELSWLRVESVSEKGASPPAEGGRVDWRRGHYVLARQLVVVLKDRAELRLPLARDTTVRSVKQFIERAVYVPRAFQSLHALPDGGALSDDAVLEHAAPGLRVELRTRATPLQHLNEQLNRRVRYPRESLRLHGGCIPAPSAAGPLAIPVGSSCLHEGVLPRKADRLARQVTRPPRQVAQTPAGHPVFELEGYTFECILGSGVSGVVSRCRSAGGHVAVKQVRKEGDLFTPSLRGGNSAPSEARLSAARASGRYHAVHGSDPRCYSALTSEEAWHEVQWLLTEVVVLRELPRHENLLWALDVLHDSEHAYLVTPVLDTTLYDLMHELELWRDPSCWASLLRQLLSGVAHLHHNGIAHRDIKCENVLIAYPPGGAPPVADPDHLPDFTLRLCDFGLCRKFTNLGVFARTSPRAQTLMYSAPAAVEAYLHEMEGRCAARKAADLTADDVFSVGACAFAMTFRVRAFAPRTLDPSDDGFWREMVVNMRKGLPGWAKPVGLWPLRGRLFPASDLVARLLSPEPESRPSAAEALADSWLRYGEQDASGLGRLRWDAGDANVPESARCGTSFHDHHQMPLVTSPECEEEAGSPTGTVWSPCKRRGTPVAGYQQLCGVCVTASEKQFLSSQMEEVVSGDGKVNSTLSQSSLGSLGGMRLRGIDSGALRPTRANRRWRRAGHAVLAAVMLQKGAECNGTPPTVALADVTPTWPKAAA